MLWGPVCRALPRLPQVGILDVDLCGPSIPRMFRVQDRDVHQCDSGWVPVFVDQEKSILLMSIGFLLEKPDDAVVWRGPKKNGTVSSCCLQSSGRSAKPLGGAAGSCSAGPSPQVSSISHGAPFIPAALIKQFVADVAWGDLDFLIVDTPPGTSDEHISTVEALRPYKPLGAILVTTPQVGQPAGAPGHGCWGGLHPK